MPDIVRVAAECANEQEQAAEIARLRQVEQAARDYIAAWNNVYTRHATNADHSRLHDAFFTLRKSLKAPEEIPHG